MGPELVFIAFWLLQTLLIVGLSAISAIYDRRLTAALIFGGLIGFSPLFLIQGPAVWNFFEMLLAAALLAIVASYIIMRRWISAVMGLIAGSTILVGAFAEHVDFASLRFLSLIHEISLLTVPLLCALASKAVAVVLVRRHDPLGT